MRDNSDYTQYEQRQLYRRLKVKRYDVAVRCKCGAKSYIRTRENICLVCVMKSGAKK